MESPILRSYRELLGVNSKSSIDDIKKAFRQLAKLYHPDVNTDPDAQYQFQNIRKAYEVLIEPRRKEALNSKFQHELLFEKKIEGLKLNFGTFFGYRFYLEDDTLVPESRRLGRESNSIGQKRKVTEKSLSITDSLAGDTFELVYAGKMVDEDRNSLKRSFKSTHTNRLPWVVLNNKGILQFLDGDYLGAYKTYKELNKRIPNNIIFLYRLGISAVVLAFQKKRVNLIGKKVAHSGYFRQGIKALKEAVQVGEEREIGKQKCVTIRKVLADIYESAGKKRMAKKFWREVYSLRPKSREAESSLVRLN